MRHDVKALQLVFVVSLSLNLGSQTLAYERGQKANGKVAKEQDDLPQTLQFSKTILPLSGSKITTPVLGWLEDSVVRSGSPDFGVAAKHSPLKLELTFNFDVGDNYRQHPLVNIDSRYPV